MAIKIAEMFYTLRKRVHQSGEIASNFVDFSGSSGMKIPFSTLKNKRTVRKRFDHWQSVPMGRYWPVLVLVMAMIKAKHMSPL